MSKVSGSYESVVRGVSEQVAHDRRPGQHAEQINMLADPVNGLSRRRGSVWQDEQVVATTTLSALKDDAGKMREYSFVIDGVEYCVLYRSTTSIRDKSSFMYLYNKTTDTFIPIVYENSSWVDQLISGGVSALTSVGRYLYLAGNDNIPQVTLSNLWDTTANLQKMVVWVRGGAYSRTFSVTLTKPNGDTTTVSYKTKPSAYPGLLDTTGIPFFETDGTTPRPNYQKDINDAVNAYNSAVTAYIGEAAEDITGENIAQKLVDELVLAGVAATRKDTSVLIDDADYIDVSAEDGGDNTLLRAVGKEVSAPTLMSLMHYVGKVVRIRPQGGTDGVAYYLKAYAKDNLATGWTEVVWREAPGVSQVPTRMFSQMIIHEGTAYVAQNGAGLEVLAPTSGDHVDYKESSVGDGVSSPTPQMFGNPITMLAVFQDRLLVGTGGTINVSRPGDYLNFFRHTVLNIQDNDSIEMFSYGAEGDTLRHAVMYDRDLIIFGDLKQYGITGKALLSAKSPNITTVSAHEDASFAAPIASGNFVFYAKHAANDDGDIRTSLHQLQIGQLTESPVSYEVSQQLAQYIQGRPAQLVAVTAPNLIVYRTEEKENSVYLYSYVDDQGGGQRLLDSWSRWDFNPVLGRLCGASSYNGSILLFSLRQSAADVIVVCDKQSLTTKPSPRPNLDSQRRADLIDGWHSVMQDDLFVAADETSEHFLIGTRGDKLDEMLAQITVPLSKLWYGAVSEALVTPTNPYMRNNGAAVLSGRLTLNQILPSITNTGGLIAEVSTINGTLTTLTFNGRILGLQNNQVAQQPVSTAQLTVGIGREVRECSYTLKSKDWLPMTITSIDWVGQYFNRVRRA